MKPGLPLTVQEFLAHKPKKRPPEEQKKRIEERKKKLENLSFEEFRKGLLEDGRFT